MASFVCTECPCVFRCAPAQHGTRNVRGKWTCSKACAAVRRTQKTLLARGMECAHCEQAFLCHRGRKNVQKFCSKTCESAARAAQTRGYTPPTATLGTVWLDLGNGAFTLIDASDAEFLSAHVWHRDARGYASTKIDGRQVLLHRMLFQNVREIDHRNRDRLDNRRVNLREATRAQNGANKTRAQNNTSGFKGVSRYRGKWGARIGVGMKRIFLGVFETREEAAAAYDRASREHHGEFAAANEENR